MKVERICVPKHIFVCVPQKQILWRRLLSHTNHAECMNPPGGVLRRLHGGGLKFQNGVGEEEGGDAQRGLKQRK